jgi:hypothetical protein
MREFGLYKGILERLRTTINEPARTQNPVRATSCGFESYLQHNAKVLQKQVFIFNSSCFRWSRSDPFDPDL